MSGELNSKEDLDAAILALPEAARSKTVRLSGSRALFSGNLDQRLYCGRGVWWNPARNHVYIELGK